MNFKKIITSIFFTILFFSFYKGADAAMIQRAPNNLGLVGYWSFNDGAGTKATDSSGNVNVGSLNGSPTWGGGRLGQAVNFGGSDYISVSDNKFLEPSIPFSISFWLKTTQTGNKVIIEKDGNAGYSVQREDNNAIKISIGDSGGTLEIESAHTYNDGKWHHVVFVAQSPASNSKVYVDSVDDTSGTPNNGFPSYSTGSLYIGSRAGSFGYQGAFDEVRIYNRALTATEVTALYRTGLSVTNSSAQNKKITNGLVGLWSFNGQDMDWSQSSAEAIDRSGQNNNGDVVGGARPISGVSGQALSFDGSNDYMTTVNNTLSGTGAISYGAWIKTTQTGQNKHIFNIGAATANNMAHMMLYDGTIKYGAWGTDLYSGLTYNDGKWHYIMVVYNTTQFLLYVDGSLENPADNYSSLNITAQPLYLGEYNGGGNYYFQGFIDDVRIYSRALTTTEITDLYKMGAARTQTNTSQVNKYKDGSLVLLQTFNGPDMDWSQSSAEARDRSGQNNNGDVIGGARPISGVSGQALSFDGIDDYAEIADHSSLDLTDAVTISTWVYDPPLVVPPKISKTTDNEITSERTYNQDVFDLGNGQKQYKIHAADINYKDDTGSFQPIDTTLSFNPADRAWEQSKASYECKIPEYADDWFDFYNEYEGTDHIIKAKPVANHVKGKVFNGQEDGNYIIYKDAFGKGIDLKVYAYRGGLKKVIIINDKPSDTNQEMTFDFELELPADAKVQDMTGAEWNKTGTLDFSSKTIKIGEDNKLSYFRDALVWDSAYINDKVKIELIVKDNKMYLRKTIVKDILQKAVYPLYTDDATSYYAGAGDGSVYSTGQDTWDIAHNMAGTYAIAYPTSEYMNLGVNTTRMYRGFFPVDTSGIDDAATITDAKLYLYNDSTRSNNDNDGDDYLNVVQTTQASPTTLVAVDYDKCGAVHSPTIGGTQIDISSIGIGYFSITLDATGIGWIKKTAGDPYTMLGVREGHDLIDSAPTGSNYVYLVFSEHTGTDQDPYLSVTVSSPVADKIIIGKGQDAYQLQIDDDLNVTGYINTSQTVTSQITKAWHHVALTYNKQNIILYVDGVQKDSKAYTTAIGTNATDLKIGDKVPGKIDEVRVYNRALSAAEILKLYKGGK